MGGELFELGPELAQDLPVYDHRRDHDPGHHSESEDAQGTAQSIERVTGRTRVLPVHAGGEGEIKAVEEGERDHALHQGSPAIHLVFLLAQKGCEDVDDDEEHKVAVEHHQHDVEVVDEVAEHAHLPQYFGHATLLWHQLDVESVEELELQQRGQVDVQERVLGQHEVGQLQDAEQLEPHDFATEHRDQQDGIADPRVRCEQFLGICLRPALVFAVVQGGDGRLVGERNVAATTSRTMVLDAMSWLYVPWMAK